MKILVDARCESATGVVPESWAATVFELVDLVYDSNPATETGEVLVLSDGVQLTRNRDADTPRGEPTFLDFAHRNTPYSTIAAEADLITHICRTLDVSVFVSTGESYARDIPFVIAVLDAPAPSDVGVATVLAHQFVVSSTLARDRLTANFPFISDVDVHVAGNAASTILRACRRAIELSVDPDHALNQPHVRSLIADYHERVRRVQI